MYVLGLNAFHGDAAAALVKDGKLIAAAEEERFRRVKHWAGFPSQAIAYCLEEAGIGLGDVEKLAINQDSSANLFRKLGYVLARRPSLKLIAGRLKNRSAREGIAQILEREFPNTAFGGEIVKIEHHLAHLYSAFYVSPFEEAAVASVDGFGDFASGAWGVGRGETIEISGRAYFPHSLGIFYQAITQFLGFPYYGDEYKIMGLAPYGEPRYINEMREIVQLRPDGAYALNLKYFRHHREQLSFEWNGDAPVFDDLFGAELERLLGPRRGVADPLEQKHKDIARSAQAAYEDAFFNLLSSLHARYGLKSVALAGGCAMNSVANGKIRRRTPFEHVYVQAAAGDAGGAVGAAFAAWRGTGGTRSFKMDHAYWGPSYSQDAIDGLIERNSAQLSGGNCSTERIDDEEALCARTADAIAAGLVVGWFQGRMEWGPRALGNRSILCDPRRADMKAILNAKIKRRESFRPFAPSILEEETGAWFEEDGSVPFMMQVFQIREAKRAEIPAVTHVDGSGRLQTVSAATNPRYHRLISCFRDRTGIPMVLNTSFNENEPVVCEPAQALDCFLRTNMDVLVLGNSFVKRGNVD